MSISRRASIYLWQLRRCPLDQISHSAQFFDNSGPSPVDCPLDTDSERAQLITCKEGIEMMHNPRQSRSNPPPPSISPY